MVVNLVLLLLVVSIVVAISSVVVDGGVGCVVVVPSAGGGGGGEEASPNGTSPFLWLGVMMLSVDKGVVHNVLERIVRVFVSLFC